MHRIRKNRKQKNDSTKEPSSDRETNILSKAEDISTDNRFGGANRDRTGDLLVANETLSQLSYGPKAKSIIMDFKQIINSNIVRQQNMLL